MQLRRECLFSCLKALRVAFLPPGACWPWLRDILDTVIFQKSYLSSHINNTDGPPPTPNPPPLPPLPRPLLRADGDLASTV